MLAGNAANTCPLMCEEVPFTLLSAGLFTFRGSTFGAFLCTHAFCMPSPSRLCSHSMCILAATCILVPFQSGLTSSLPQAEAGAGYSACFDEQPRIRGLTGV